jgi:Na+-transporting methylmalonyl-CoA/oxaloacetate decarboxylase gamma subunit
MAFGDLNGDGRDEIVDPVLGSHLAVYRALYYPGHVVLTGPTSDNLVQVQGLSMLPQEVNLTSSVASWMKSAGKDGVGNVTYRMNLTADHAGMVRVSSLTVTYKIETPPAKSPRTYSPQGMAVTLVLLGLLIVVSLSIGAPAAPKEAQKRPAKAAPKKAPKPEDVEEPGPVIVRAPPSIQVKAGKDDWDKARPGKATAKKETRPAPPKGPPVKVEVVKAGWRPTKQSVEHQKFEKAAELREKIKTEKKVKRKDDD